MRDMKKHIGKVFNHLTVLSIERGPAVNGRRKTFFICSCSCGKEKRINASNVITSSTKSCGCQRNVGQADRNKEYVERVFTTPVEDRLQYLYKGGAKRLGRKYELSKERFVELVNGDCHYCGIPPTKIRTNKARKISKPLNGIDRLDSSKGYIEGNVVSCCTNCNVAKLDNTVDDFIVWVNRVYKHLNKIT